jgi:hypothetical protein
MELAVTKSKITSKTIAAALAAVTLATALTATSAAQARPRFGAGLGIGLAAGALIGAAAVSTYGGPVYVRECHYVRRYDNWGNYYLIKVCD